jgi:hypothetical protein
MTIEKLWFKRFKQSYPVPCLRNETDCARFFFWNQNVRRWIEKHIKCESASLQYVGLPGFGKSKRDVSHIFPMKIQCLCSDVLRSFRDRGLNCNLENHLRAELRVAWLCRIKSVNDPSQFILCDIVLVHKFSSIWWNRWCENIDTLNLMEMQSKYIMIHRFSHWVFSGDPIPALMITTAWWHLFRMRQILPILVLRFSREMPKLSDWSGRKSFFISREDTRMKQESTQTERKTDQPRRYRVAQKQRRFRREWSGGRRWMLWC